MSAKHTPGPWQRLQHGMYVGHCGDSGVTITAGAGGATPQEAAANARLIAAAPQLLDAVRLAFQYFDSDDSPDALRVRAEMVAAIEATGGEA